MSWKRKCQEDFLYIMAFHMSRVRGGDNFVRIIGQNIDDMTNGIKYLRLPHIALTVPSVRVHFRTRTEGFKWDDGPKALAGTARRTMNFHLLPSHVSIRNTVILSADLIVISSRHSVVSCTPGAPRRPGFATELHTPSVRKIDAEFFQQVFIFNNAWKTGGITSEPL
jgi:hypothetical protein